MSKPDNDLSSTSCLGVGEPSAVGALSSDNFRVIPLRCINDVGKLERSGGEPCDFSRVSGDVPPPKSMSVSRRTSHVDLESR